MASKHEAMQLKAMLNQCLVDLKVQEGSIAILAQEYGCQPWEVKNADGDFLLAQLLVSRANVLNGLAILMRE